jgi:Fis family transcriptional regulator, factor for inversion stimulation protein
VQEKAGAAMAVSKVGRTLADIEREHILDTLIHCEGNRTYAANILDISVRGLRNKLSLYSRAGWTVSAGGCVRPPTAWPFAAKRNGKDLDSIVWC